MVYFVAKGKSGQFLYYLFGVECFRIDLGEHKIQFFPGGAIPLPN